MGTVIHSITTGRIDSGKLQFPIFQKCDSTVKSWIIPNATIDRCSPHYYFSPSRRVIVSNSNAKSPNFTHSYMYSFISTDDGIPGDTELKSIAIILIGFYYLARVIFS